MLITRLLTPFPTLGTDCCSFSLVFSSLPSLLHFSHTDTPCPPLSLINPPSPTSSSQLFSTDPPEAVGEGGRDGERQDRPALLKTLFMPGTKPHVISARGETLRRVWEGREGEVFGTKGGKEDGGANQNKSVIKLDDY